MRKIIIGLLLFSVMTLGIFAGEPNSFEVLVNGKLMFSKFETGRFPYQGEIVKKSRFYIKTT